MSFDLYVWKAPPDLDAQNAEAQVTSWQEAGADPSSAPFESTTDVGWFYVELTEGEPGVETTSDAVPRTSRTPIWLGTSEVQPARIVAIRLSNERWHEELDTIFGLAAKYDLVVFDPRERRLHRPLEELAAYASATFWPRGAIRAAVAGGVGGVAAVVAWSLGIPVISGLVTLIGGFLFVMAVYTFVHEVRKTLAARRGRSGPPPDDRVRSGP
jgi:hypothetical protein